MATISVGDAVFIIPIREYGTVAKVRASEEGVIYMVKRLNGQLHGCRAVELQSVD